MKDPRWKCKEPGCGGQINLANIITLEVGCSSCAKLPVSGYPCRKCARIYNSDTSLAFSENNRKIFFRGGKIVEE